MQHHKHPENGLKIKNQNNKFKVLVLIFYTSLAAKIIVANWLRSPHSARNVIVKACIRVFDTISKLLLPNRSRHLFGACCSMSASCWVKVNVSKKHTIYLAFKIVNKTISDNIIFHLSTLETLRLGNNYH